MITENKARAIAADHATDEFRDPMTLLSDHVVIIDFPRMYARINSILGFASESPHLSNQRKQEYFKDMRELREWVEYYAPRESNRRTKLVGIVGTLVTVVSLAALTIGITVEEDGSGSLGTAQTATVTYCLPWALCND